MSKLKEKKKKEDRSRGNITHQNKEKNLETLAEETRAEKEKYAESMERGRRRKRIRCAGSAGEGGWFSASGGNDVGVTLQIGGSPRADQDGLGQEQPHPGEN